jgi:hypothetical protein
MSPLRECQECHRHIRLSESVCPFCSQAVSASSSRSPLRAAIFAGAIAGASAMGCGDAKPAVEDPSDTTDSVQVGQSDAMFASPVDSETVDGESQEERDEEVDPRENWDRKRRVSDPNQPPMPYGAPPARRRLV